MLQNLRMLYNSLNLVETRGESTKQMAICMQFLEGLIKEAEDPTQPTPPAHPTSPEHVTAEVVE